MNTCRIKGKKREEKENKIQIVPLWRDEDRLTIREINGHTQDDNVGAFLRSTQSTFTIYWY